MKESWRLVLLEKKLKTLMQPEYQLTEEEAFAKLEAVYGLTVINSLVDWLERNR